MNLTGRQEERYFLQGKGLCWWETLGNLVNIYIKKKNTFLWFGWQPPTHTHTHTHTYTINHSYFLVSLNFYLSSIIAIIPLHYIISGILISVFIPVNFFFVSLTCAWHVLRSICWMNIWITDYYTYLLTGWNPESLNKIKSHLSSRGWCQFCSYLSVHCWDM